MFEKIVEVPADPILGLTEKFKADPNPEKINLGVGVYKNPAGKTPILESVRLAEAELIKTQDTKSYLGIPGMPEIASCVQKMVFGEGHEIIESKRACTAQTPGGTGALRVAGDFIRKVLPGAKIWLSDPTWANHNKIFNAAGLVVATYPYYDSENKCLAFDKMKEALAEVPEGDVVLFHACCHNPTGMDPTPAQWKELAQVAAERKFLPFFDFAYQGFGNGLEEDAVSVREFAKPGCEMFVASSYSKNFGLYNERIGALTLVARTAQEAAAAFSHMKICIRTNYSNPPVHGAAIVTTILNDPKLYEMWVGEVTEMRERIKKMRELFVSTLAAKGVKEDFSHINAQCGMFSYSGLTKDKVEALRDKYSIYIVGSGRINVAGMTEQNMNSLCEAIAQTCGGNARRSIR